MAASSTPVYRWRTIHPTRVAISVLNTNYTCDLLKESGVFALSVLDEQCTFDSIKHFGFQSGRDVDKFEGIKMPEDVNGIPYMGWYACAVISGKVVESHDLGTHTLFIAEVVVKDEVNGHDRSRIIFFAPIIVIPRF